MRRAAQAPVPPKDPENMSFSPEPTYQHGNVGRSAVLLVNLGTPMAPTAAAVRRYLREFLSDPRVVEIPRLAWWPILNGLILPLRPRKSAAKYATIWTNRGSPLLLNSEQQALLLRGYLGERGLDVEVALAMRYGEPSIAAVMDQLRGQGVERLLLVPMYPQYSAATTASVCDAVFAYLRSARNIPELRIVKHFHDDSGYIAALKASVLALWKKAGRPQRGAGKLLMSFHGVPKRTLLLGDPYHCECQKTGRLLAEALGLDAADYRVTFQSRFGRAEWLQPYTAPSLVELAKAGVERVDVICPGFTADCLETLEEIALEGRAEFLGAGGREFNYIPCVNDSPGFIAALADLVERHVHGWPTARAERERRESEAIASRERARALGAER
jgi:protoporphyrin/coproporphyrin ferrochelatase